MEAKEANIHSTTRHDFWSLFVLFPFAPPLAKKRASAWHTHDCPGQCFFLLPCCLSIFECLRECHARPCVFHRTGIRSSLPWLRCLSVFDVFFLLFFGPCPWSLTPFVVSLFSLQRTAQQRPVVCADDSVSQEGARRRERDARAGRPPQGRGVAKVQLGS